MPSVAWASRQSTNLRSASASGSCAARQSSRAAASTAARLVGHLRTTGSLGQQVEADEVYIAEYPDGRRVVPIEAKGAKEKLGRSQIKSLIDAVFTKIPGLPVIPLGLKLGDDGLILIVQFDFQRAEDTGAITAVEIAGAAQFRFEPQLPLWPPVQML